MSYFYISSKVTNKQRLLIHQCLCYIDHDEGSALVDKI